ncbi:MAG: helix-turn-helix domain-containing protein [Clostridia bacterium]|nr:helix-turn-helix transcriptional regulator [Eubacterium sp.]MBR2560190.1 helix-turn-helix transcriptional regulator [Bacillota bacterium]MBR3212195.1 helix-turn-helix transcriptional regulator [Bacillota bacterium]MCR4668480.1 helix-turn-helix domain-containing protein [Clostridia bacterium]
MRIRRPQSDLADSDIDTIALISDAMAHPVRLALFRYVMQCNKSMTPVCNKDLVARFGYSQSTISQHMDKLIISGLLDTKKEKKYTYYYANLGVLMRYINLTKRYSVV